VESIKAGALQARDEFDLPPVGQVDRPILLMGRICDLMPNPNLISS